MENGDYSLSSRALKDRARGILMMPINIFGITSHPIIAHHNNRANLLVSITRTIYSFPNSNNEAHLPIAASKTATSLRFDLHSCLSLW